MRVSSEPADHRGGGDRGLTRRNAQHIVVARHAFAFAVAIRRGPVEDEFRGRVTMPGNELVDAARRDDASRNEDDHRRTE